jgi:hypothetical protein
MEKTGFVYIWHDTKRNRFYIGCHLGAENDGYICSSNMMRDAYRRRPNDFRRRILKKNIKQEELLNEEHKWLQLIPDDQLGRKYYNITKHHFGHWSADLQNSKNLKTKLSNIAKELHEDPDYRNKYLEGLKKRNNKQTPEQIEKRAAACRGKKRTEEQKLRIWNAIPKGSDHPNYEKSLPEETKKKISEATQGEKNHFFGKHHSEETKKTNRQKISKAMKGIIPKNINMFKGSCWWNDGRINKRSIECPVGDGWIKGRIPWKQRKAVTEAIH